MNYFRTSSGSMMAVNIKSTTHIAVSKPKSTVKTTKKAKKDSTTYPK